MPDINDGIKDGINDGSSHAFDESFQQALAQDQNSEDEQRRLIERQQRIQVIANKLETMAESVSKDRQAVEIEWLKFELQYAGRYDEKTLKNIEDRAGSKVYVKQTRPKVDNFVAKIFDMYFAGDDNFWGIDPTPEPALIKAVASEDLPSETEEPDGEKAQARKIIRQAREACDNMSTLMDDQITENRFAREARDVLETAARLGTGILKGPIDDGLVRTYWDADPETGEWRLQSATEMKPAFRHTPVWNFFPDPDATNIEDCGFTFERHVKTPKAMRKLAKNAGFNSKAIRALLKQGAQGRQPEFMQKMRGLEPKNDHAQNKPGSCFIVWEYRGPLEGEDLAMLYRQSGGESGLEVAEEIDPLEELDVVLYVCQGHVLKFGENHLESGESLYSIYRPVKVPGSFWGEGIPSMMENSQSAMNAAFRMIMDNAAISTGPQLVIDKSAIEPENGSYQLKPFKVWLKTSTALTQSPFTMHEVRSNQEYLANIYALSRQIMDEETGLPLIAQGEQGKHVTQTATGMSLLMGSANINIKRAVRDFDDDLIEPALTRLYEFNMLYHHADNVKGDMRVKVLGASSLLVRDIEAQNVITLMDKYAANPVFGPLMKPLDAFRRVVKVAGIDPSEIVKSDEELKEEETARAEADQQGEVQKTPEVLAAEIRLQIVEREGEIKKELAAMARDTEMIKFAEANDLELSKLEAILDDKAEERAHKERKHASELGIKRQMGSGI